MASLTDSIDIEDVETEEILQTIQGKLAALRAHINLLNLQRSKVLNDYLDLKGNIRVFCRIRPSLPLENSQTQSVIVLDDSNMLLRIENKEKKYNFDRVFHPHSTQEEVFSEVEPVIKSALDGYNVCIFAYGQTGTGKTFTMEGRSDCPGVVWRAMHTLFDQAQTVNCRLTFGFSMLEIYMGQLRDLLVPQRVKSCLSIQMDHSGSIKIEKLVEIRVSDFGQVKRLYGFGRRLRSTASTMSNTTSSRSHCLIRISITSAAPGRHRTSNKIWMVDLGGSERLLKTQASGRRLEEGKAINLSLSALGDVISSLHSKKSHVPYRNSKLTQVLRDSLGEDSKTLMLVHVSPKEQDLCETICTLGFATRVRSIHLGEDEPPDVRAYKEFVMSELLQKLNDLESESQCVIKDIKELNEDIEKLNEKFKQSGENDMLNNKHLNVQDEKYSMKTSQHTRDVKEVLTNVPRFMRPTICSRRKVRMNELSESTKKKQRVASRRPHSDYTAVLHSDQGSESSISRFVQIGQKYDADIATECSQDISECEIKTVIFTEQQRVPSCSDTSEDCQKEKVCPKEHVGVDNLFPFHSKPLRNSGSQRSERVCGLLQPEQSNILNEPIADVTNNKIDAANCSNIRHSFSTRKENGHEYKNTDLFANAGGQKIGEDMLEEESSTSVESSKEVLAASLLLGKDVNWLQNVEHTRMDQGPKPVCEGETWHTSSPQKSEFGNEQSVSFDQTEDTEFSVSPKENTPDLCRNYEGPFASNVLIEKLKDSSIPLVRFRRSLCLLKHSQIIDQKNAAADQDCVEKISTKFEEPNRGTWQFLDQVVQMIHAMALLGLGSQSLACSDDFCYGLML